MEQRAALRWYTEAVMTKRGYIVFETVAMGFLNLQSWAYSFETILEKGMLGIFVIIFLWNLFCFRNTCTERTE